MTCVANQSDDGSNVDDTGIFRFHQSAHECFYGVESPLEIGIQHYVPVFFFHSHEQTISRDSGIVDKNVDATEIGNDLLAQFLNGLVIGHIHGIGFCAAGEARVQFICDRSATGRAETDASNFCPLFRECGSNRLSNAPAATGNNCNFSFK